MTTTKMNRCAHCKTVYPYHPSTYGITYKYNDDRYCPGCAEVIAKALKSVPKKFERRWIPTSDYTREQIIAAQDLRCSQQSVLPIRRVFPPLFDMKDPSNNHLNVCELMDDPKTGKKISYKATWWTKELDNVEVKKEVWWDIEKDNISTNQENYK